MKEKTKHTAGPWESARMLHSPKDKDRRCGFVINGPDKGQDLPLRVCDLRAPAGFDGFAVVRANAALIAAAPDMLAALRSILAALSQPATFPADLALCRMNAREAIAKAEGNG
jgi:hypothetical protein